MEDLGICLKRDQNSGNWKEQMFSGGTLVGKEAVPIKAANRRRKKVVNADRKNKSCGQVDGGI